MHYVSLTGFLTFDFNVKWRFETFDVINVIIVRSVVMLNMNTEVLRIHDMNTLYKIGDLIFYVSVWQVWLCAELAPIKVAELAPDRLFPNITWQLLLVREPVIGLIKWLRPKGLKVCSYVEKCSEFKNQTLKKIGWYTIIRSLDSTKKCI